MKTSYAELKNKLDKILVELQDPDTDLDKAIELHKEATKVLAELEKYLATVKKSK